MKQIELILCDPKEQNQKISLFYDVLKTPIASKYFQALEEVLRHKVPIIDPDRFHNFPHDHRNQEWIAEELNKCIGIINQYSPNAIEREARPDMDQELTNHLHKYFEDYRGNSQTPAMFFSQAPVAVKKALESFNLLIHRYEDTVRNQWRCENSKYYAATMFLTFRYDRKRYPLNDESFLGMGVRRRSFDVLKGF